MEVKLGTLLFSKVKSLISLHGVLVLLWGQGLLVLGASGAGKTDVALELIRRGHQLVADDAVELFCPEPAVVWGRPLKSGPHPMAVYGVGVIRAEQVWGAAAVANQAPIRQVIELVDVTGRSYENPLEAGGQTLYLMGVAVPYLALAQERRPHLATLMELAIRQRWGKKEMSESVSVGDEHG
jgi:HPr kinase/phosphorylase